MTDFTLFGLYAYFLYKFMTWGRNGHILLVGYGGKVLGCWEKCRICFLVDVFCILRLQVLGRFTYQQGGIDCIYTLPILLLFAPVHFPTIKFLYPDFFLKFQYFLSNSGFVSLFVA